MGGRRFLANGPGKRIADAGEAEARSEQRPGIGHQRKAGEAVDDGLGQDRFRRRPQDVAAGMAEGYDPRPEAGRHGQGIGTVLERDERPRLGRLDESAASSVRQPDGAVDDEAGFAGNDDLLALVLAPEVAAARGQMAAMDLRLAQSSRPNRER